MQHNGLNFFELTMALVGGLALFLYGLEKMTNALKGIAGDKMRRVMSSLTRNRFMGVGTGAFVTGVIQSSTVTTVLTVGFVSAGIMTLAQSVGVIMGANIGTTMTAQIIAFKVTKYALLLVAVGFFSWYICKQDRAKDIGALIMGLGLIFFGMDLMINATKPLRSYEPFIEVMKSMNNPFLGILVAGAFTAIIQSSSAVTGMIIVLASQGFISLEAGIALALGANVGTCVTALLAAIGKPREALQTASVHVFFNVAGALIWVGLIHYLADFARMLSPAAANLSGVERLAYETPRQIANAHTIFNVANTLLFLPFTNQIANVIVRLFPTKSNDDDLSLKAKYLDTVYLKTPSIAIDSLRREISRLGHVVEELLVTVFNHSEKPEFDKNAIEDKTKKVEALNYEIIKYSQKLFSRKLTSEESEEAQQLLTITNYLRAMSDCIELDMGALSAEWDERHFKASDETQVKLKSLFDIVMSDLKMVVNAVKKRDERQLREVMKSKKQIKQMTEDLNAHLTRRLGQGNKEQRYIFQIEIAVVEIFARLHYFLRKIAKS